MKYKIIKQSKKEIELEEMEEETIQQIPAKTIIWGEIADEKMEWEEAKKWCKEQGGRLPTRVELLQAFEAKVEGFKEGFYWSSTEFGSYDAWYVYFSNGYVNYGYKNYGNYVRCVRDK